MHSNTKRSLVRGFFVGLGVCLALLVVVALLNYDGQCGNGGGFFGSHRYSCSFLEFLVDPQGLLLIMGFGLYAFWWLIPIIVGATMLAVYGLSGRSKN